MTHVSKSPKAFAAQSKKTKHVYYLHSKIVTLRNRNQLIYYFSPTIDEEFAVREMPVGFTIVENVRTGLPLLKKIENSKE